jgi:hypothetical protein
MASYNILLLYFLFVLADICAMLSPVYGHSTIRAIDHQSGQSSKLGITEKPADLEYEDFVVMQAEISWGIKEMNRYKECTGNWPIRVDARDDFLAMKQHHTDPYNRERVLNRKKMGKYTDYWDVVISVF